MDQTVCTKTTIKNPKDSGHTTTPEFQRPAVDENKTTPRKQQGKIARQENAANFPGLLGAPRRHQRRSGSFKDASVARRLRNAPIRARQALQFGNPPVAPRPSLIPPNAPRPLRRPPAISYVLGPVQRSPVVGNAPVQARRALQFGNTPVTRRPPLIPPNTPWPARRPPASRNVQGTIQLLSSLVMGTTPVQLRRAVLFNGHLQTMAPFDNYRLFRRATALGNAYAQVSNRSFYGVVVIGSTAYLITDDSQFMSLPRILRAIRRLEGNNSFRSNGQLRRDLFCARGQPITFDDDNDTSDIGWALPNPLCKQKNGHDK